MITAFTTLATTCPTFWPLIWTIWPVTESSSKITTFNKEKLWNFSPFATRSLECRSFQSYYSVYPYSSPVCNRSVSDPVWYATWRNSTWCAKCRSLEWNTSVKCPQNLWLQYRTNRKVALGLLSRRLLPSKPRFWSFCRILHRQWRLLGTGPKY